VYQTAPKNTSSAFSPRCRLWQESLGRNDLGFLVS
jgi:hypothetical protein